MPKNRFTALDDEEVEVLCQALDLFINNGDLPGRMNIARGLQEELENSYS